MIEVLNIQTMSSISCIVIFIFLNFKIVFNFQDMTTAPTNVENGNKKKNPGYRTKEVIEKAPLEDYPCTLIRTSERISFPALRNELFVNILGYREPNLVRVRRCKGLCGDRDRPIACRVTKVGEHKVMMMFRTNSSGRDSKHRIKELILDEHIECGWMLVPQHQRMCWKIQQCNL